MNTSVLMPRFARSPELQNLTGRNCEGKLLLDKHLEESPMRRLFFGVIWRGFGPRFAMCKGNPRTDNFKAGIAG
jgi:hypothetical protein